MEAMKTLNITPGRYRVLQSLTREEIALLKKHPKLLLESRHLIRACKKVIKRIESISEYASRRKRQTAYKRITVICQKAIERIEK
jgi:hypothetical protein